MPLNLAVGQSISVVHFAILVRPDDVTDNYSATSSGATATATATATKASTQ